MFHAKHYAEVFEKGVEVIRLSNNRGIMLQFIPNHTRSEGVVLTITLPKAIVLIESLVRELDSNHHYAGKDDEK